MEWDFSQQALLEAPTQTLRMRLKELWDRSPFTLVCGQQSSASPERAMSCASLAPSIPNPSWSFCTLKHRASLPQIHSIPQSTSPTWTTSDPFHPRSTSVHKHAAHGTLSRMHVDFLPTTLRCSRWLKSQYSFSVHSERYLVVSSCHISWRAPLASTPSLAPASAPWSAAGRWAAAHVLRTQTEKKGYLADHAPFTTGPSWTVPKVSEKHISVVNNSNPNEKQQVHHGDVGTTHTVDATDRESCSSVDPIVVKHEKSSSMQFWNQPCGPSLARIARVAWNVLMTHVQRKSWLVSVAGTVWRFLPITCVVHHHYQRDVPVPAFFKNWGPWHCSLSLSPTAVLQQETAKLLIAKRQGSASKVSEVRHHSTRPPTIVLRVRCCGQFLPHCLFWRCGNVCWLSTDFPSNMRRGSDRPVHFFSSCMAFFYSQHRYWDSGVLNIWPFYFV